jgi:hypothetical protein
VRIGLGRNVMSFAIKRVKTEFGLKRKEQQQQQQ